MTAPSFSTFCAPLLTKLTSKVALKNTPILLQRLLKHGKMQLFAASESKNEYKKLRNEITSGEKQGHLNSTVINETLRDTVAETAKNETCATLIHDPSELRKQYSKELENIGKVRDLGKNVINGYDSFNTVATFGNSKQVHLMQNEVYSNRQPNFLKAEDIENLKKGKDFPGQDAAKALYESDDYINRKRVSQDNMRSASTALKSVNPSIKVEHILDREYDDEEQFDFIEDELGDKFIIRLKASRILQNLYESKPYEKLTEYDFENSDTYVLQNISLHNKAYQDVKLTINYEKVGNRTVVKIEMKDRNGNAIFKQPMLLITNHPIHNIEQAREIYLSYLKRWRIESVFKFVKSALGWEEFRLKDFNGIKTLIAIGFFIASYLYKIGERELDEDLSGFLSQIGGGKGVVSRHFIWEGIRNLLIKYKVDEVFRERKPTQETVTNLKNIVGMNF